VTTVVLQRPATTVALTRAERRPVELQRGGLTGPRGFKGDPGPGMAGGDQGQLLVKQSATDGDSTWVDEIRNITVPLTSGVQTDVEIAFDGELTGWTLLGNTVGSAIVSIWKTDFTNYPPTAENSITGTAPPPSIAADDKAISYDLTGWDTLLSRGDILRFNVTSEVSITRLSLILRMRVAYQPVLAEPLVMGGVPPVSTIVGGIYSFVPQVQGGTAPYVFSLTGTIPAGTTFDPETGRVSGTTTSAQIYNWIIHATDALGDTAQKAYTFNVQPPVSDYTIEDLIDDLGSRMVLFDANDTDLLVRNGSGVASTWTDSIHGVVLTAIGSPLVVLDDLNGHAAVRFTGTEYFSRIATITSEFALGAEEGYIFALASFDAVDTAPRALATYGGSTNASNRALQKVNLSGVSRFQARSSGGPVHATSVYAGKHVVMGHWPPAVSGITSIEGEYDGTAMPPVVTTLVTNTAGDRIRIGADNLSSGNPLQRWIGDVSLVIFIKGSLTTQEHDNILLVLNNAPVTAPGGGGGADYTGNIADATVIPDIAVMP